MTVNEGVNKDEIVNAEATEGVAVEGGNTKIPENLAKLATTGIEKKAEEALGGSNEVGESTREVDEKIAAVIKKATEMIEAVEGDQESQSEGERVVKDALEYFKGDKEAMRRYFEDLAQEYSTVMPVENSVVRIKQQTEILKALEAGTPVVIEAHKRQGKTSMLKSLGNQWQEKNGTEPLYIDMNKRDSEWAMVSPEQFQSELGKKEIIKFINNNFSEISPAEVASEMDGKNPFQALDNLMGKYGKEALLEIDELFQTGKKNDGRLETLAENLKNLKNVKVLLAWHPFDTVSEQAGAAFKEYARTPIKPLSLEDAKILIERPLKKLGSDVSFSDEAIKKIFDYAGGRPMDMNLFCGQLTGGGDFVAAQTMRYEKKDIEDFIAKNNLNDTYFAAQGFRAISADIPEIYRLDLNKEHKNAINLLIKSGGEVKISDIAEQNANELINIGLVLRDEENNTYKINGDLAYNLLKEQVEQSS